MKSSLLRHEIILRIGALLMILALVFSFSACGSNEQGSADEDQAAQTEENTETAEETKSESKGPAFEPKTVQKQKSQINVLTGELGSKKNKIKTRVVGIVVENHPQSRPQWGMDDPKYSPDIILEGEVEGGFTRMFWMWADYNALPDYVGPVRSARPPFILFSEFFDSYFVHWGRSHTEAGYTGASYYFKRDNIAHLDGMYYERTAPFDRKQGTGRAIEHTAIVYGDQLPKTLESKFRTKLTMKKCSKLNFYRTKKARGKKKSCYGLTLKFSDRTQTTEWKYNEKDKKYYSSSFQTNVARDNLLVLFDNTSYQTKPGYTTYCNYEVGGGKGYYASCGAVQKIEWKVKKGKLYLYEKGKVKAAPGAKAKKSQLSMNPGKTWIGWASANHNGKCSITPAS